MLKTRKNNGRDEILCQFPNEDEEFRWISISEIDEIRTATQGILIENNKILLVESINQRKLDIPGGGIKKGEIYSETLKREFCEETGFIVEPVRILGIVESCFYYKEKEKVFHNIRIHYLTKKTGGEIKTQRNGTDTFGAGWYDIDDLKKGKYSGSILEVAEEALENFVFKKKEEIIRR